VSDQLYDMVPSSLGKISRL